MKSTDNKEVKEYKANKEDKENKEEIIARYLEGRATDSDLKFVDAMMIQLELSDPVDSLSFEEKEAYEVDLNQKVREIKAYIENTKSGTSEFISSKYSNSWQKSSQRIVFYSIAASLTLLITLGILYRNFIAKSFLPEPGYISYQAPMGSPSYLRLPDRSEIWLNGGTKIQYPKQFAKNIREVKLLDGEAFFVVQHEPDRPFIVYSGSLITKDIGTSFNIKSYLRGSSTTVSVVSGEVQVSLKNLDLKNLDLKKGEDTQEDLKGTRVKNLTAHQQVRYEYNKHALVRADFSNLDCLGWKEGGFCFLDERLSDIIIELNHRLKVDIKLKGSKLADARFTGRFPKGSTASSILKLFCELNGNTLLEINPKEFLIQGI